jgi:hypothetical protein
MQRVLSHLKWKATWWISQQGMRTDVRSDIQEGLVAYSEKQSALLWKMGMQFASQWLPVLMEHGLPTEWPDEFLPYSRNSRASHNPSSAVSDDNPLPLDDDTLPLNDDPFE